MPACHGHISARVPGPDASTNASATTASDITTARATKRGERVIGGSGLRAAIIARIGVGPCGAFKQLKLEHRGHRGYTEDTEENQCVYSCLRSSETGHAAWFFLCVLCVTSVSSV